MSGRIRRGTIVDVHAIEAGYRSMTGDDAVRLRQRADVLLARRRRRPTFSARHAAPEAFAAMHLLSPTEAADLWDRCMLTSSRGSRRMARGE